MKKIYVILLTLICLMGFGLSFNKVEAAANEVTVSMTTFTSLNGNVGGDDNVTYSAAKGGGTSAAAISGEEIRLYQNSNGTGGGYITIESKNDAKIKSITIGSSMATSVAYSEGSATATKSASSSIAANRTYTYTTSSDVTSVTFHCMGKDKNSRLYVNSLSVTYTVVTSADQDEVNAVTPMMSMGYTYTKESSSSVVTKYAKVTSLDELTDGTSIYLVGTNSDGEAYVAGASNSTYLNAVEARISSDGYLNLPDNAKPLVVNAGYTLSYDKNFVGSDSNKNLTFSTTATNWSITLDAKTSAATIVDANNFPIMFNYNNGTNPRFKAYASTFTQGKLPTLYKAIEVTDVVSTYTNVEFRLKCGVDKTTTDALMELADVNSYGIYVTAGEETRYYDVSGTEGYSETDNLYYVVISLGDVLNNIDRATTEFTIGAYIQKTDDSYVLSDTTKTYSVASLVNTYYGMDSAREQVADLYNLFSDRGYYAA